MPFLLASHNAPLVSGLHNTFRGSLLRQKVPDLAVALLELPTEVLIDRFLAGKLDAQWGTLGFGSLTTAIHPTPIIITRRGQSVNKVIKGVKHYLSSQNRQKQNPASLDCFSLFFGWLNADKILRAYPVRLDRSRKKFLMPVMVMSWEGSSAG